MRGLCASASPTLHEASVIIHDWTAPLPWAGQFPHSSSRSDVLAFIVFCSTDLEMDLALSHPRPSGMNTIKDDADPSHS